MRKKIPLFKIIFILFLTIGLFFIYDHQSEQFASDPILKKSQMSQYLTDTPPHTPEVQDIAEDVEKILDEVEVDSSKIVDTTRQHILMIGDSMAGGAGLQYGFSIICQFNQHRLTVKHQSSSTTQIWSQERKVEKFVQEFQPTYIIIALGSNELFVRDAPDRAAFVKDMLAQTKGIRTIWVGPPNWREDSGLNKMLEETLPETQFFSSKDLTLPRQADGIHPNIQGSLIWSQAVSEWINQESQHKIVLNIPPEEMYR